MTYQGDATALSGENEICDDCIAKRKAYDQACEAAWASEDEIEEPDEPKIGLEHDCEACIAICLDEEEHYDSLARDHDAQR